MDYAQFITIDNGESNSNPCDWIVLIQTFVWPIFFLFLIIWFRRTLGDILRAVADRIKSGAPIKAGPDGITIGAIPKDIENLMSAPQREASEAKQPPTDWRLERQKEYERVDGYMMVHVYRPSKVKGQLYDIFLFLVRHETGSDGPPRRHFDEIEKAEFFFGKSWGNEVFTVSNTGGVIGVRTRAWGTFLACCRITFKKQQRQPMTLFRYVDFHMLQDNPETE